MDSLKAALIEVSKQASNHAQIATPVIQRFPLLSTPPQSAALNQPPRSRSPSRAPRWLPIRPD
eukprot:6951820-Prorocentrum_lima.AAC.1